MKIVLLVTACLMVLLTMSPTAHPSGRPDLGGAFVGIFAAGEPPAATAALRELEALRTPERRCGVAHPPGPGCATDVARWSSAGIAPVAGKPDPVPAGKGTFASGTRPAPPKDPPRSA